MAERLVVRNSLLKIPFALLFIVALAALGAFAPQLGFDWDPDREWLRWPCVILFAGFAVYAGFRFFDDRAQAVIGPEGLFIRYWSNVTIPWSAIARCAVKKQQLTGFAYRRHICLYLRDPSLYPPAKRWTRLLIGDWNHDFGDIIMPTGGLEQDIPELMAAIRKYAVPAGVEVTE
jgi:hypothetical protein